MKRFILISIFALIFSSVNYAQVAVYFNGTVTDINTGQPIVNEYVEIWTDSTALFYFHDYVYTNSNGQYQDSVILPTNNPLNFYFYMMDCNGIPINQTVLFNGNTNITVDFQICVTPPVTCMADFYASSPSNTFSFVDYSIGNPSSWSWDFGDGGVSTLQNPVHTFATSGYHWVCLSIVGPNCTDSWCQSVYSSTPYCNSWFTFTNQGLSFSFSGAVTNGVPPYNYNWNFGDGTTGTGNNPSHVYAQEGYYYVTLTTIDGNGCTHTSNNYCSYFCSAAFSPSNPVGTGISFYDYSQGDPTSWSWNFGDNSTSTQQSPNHTYPNPGIYNVCLTINGPYGCIDTVCELVNVITSENCYANFYYTPDPILANTINFWDNSTGNVYSYSWYFSDGTTSTAMNPQHVFSGSGTHYACLEITNNSTGCHDNFCSQVIIGGTTLCQAYFYKTPDTTNPTPGSYVFHDLSGGSPTSYAWDFGDGGTSTLQNPTHTFTSSGYSVICLTIQNSTCQSTWCDTSWVGSLSCYNYFTYSMMGLTYSFQGYPYSGTPPYTYNWDFGDGTTATGNNLTHVYAQGGNYMVTLTTIDINNCTFTSTQILTGQQPCSNSFTFTNQGQDYTFTAYAANGIPPYNFSWDFGDGNTATGNNPTHSFNQSGTYVVTLTTSDGNSCTATSSQSITITISCEALFNFYQDSTVNNTIQFQNMSSGNLTNYLWDFGDGSTSTLMNPQHVYANVGVYNVCLTVSDNSSGCQGNFCYYVYVSISPVCQAHMIVASGSGSNSIEFFDASTGNPTAYLWNFGDGSFSTMQDPTHLFPSAGLFNTCLTISGPNCQSTNCFPIVFTPPPCYCCFNYTNLGSLVYGFRGHSTYDYPYPYGGSTSCTYSWDFGDGMSGTGIIPTHNYSQAGTYVVNLTVTDTSGCISTFSQNVYAGLTIDNIYGQVTANNTGLDQGVVVLYNQDLISGLLVPVDSSLVDSSGSYCFYYVVPGTYYLKAYPTANSAFYTTYAPTYYQSSIFWAGGTPVIIGTAANPYDIALAAILGPNPGNGSISGGITQGAKLFAQGPPVPDVEILLLNMSNQSLSMVYSDAAGQFAFHNLAMGTYKVYAEVTGLSTIAYIVTLSNSSPDNNNVELIKTPSGITTGLSEPTAVSDFSILSIYPNPAKDIVTLDIESAKPTLLTAELYDITGKRVMIQTLNLNTGKDSYKLNLNGLQAGFYTLSLTSDTGLKTTQKLTLLP